MTYRRKLIEVALPLEAINRASAREKGVRGHPNTLHQWWARRPLAACRAVIFASMVDDPSSYLPEPQAGAERERLFRLLEQLVEWSGATDERVLARARLEIACSVARGAGLPEPRTERDVQHLLREVAPPVYDPFSGSGSIPVDAQRLGLRSLASDLNPVAVLMTCAVMDLQVRFANRPPVNPSVGAVLADVNWRGTAGFGGYGGYVRPADALDDLGLLRGQPVLRRTGELDAAGRLRRREHRGGAGRRGPRQGRAAGHRHDDRLGHTGDGQHRSALLRQHRLRAPIQLLLHLAPPDAAPTLSRAVRDVGDSQAYSPPPVATLPPTIR